MIGAASPWHRVPRWLRITGLMVVVLGALGLAAAWLVAPSLIKDRAEHWLAERSGHVLNLGRVEVNPLQLRATLSDVTLQTPQFGQLLRFDRLLIDFSLASLLRRAPAFDAIRLDGLRLWMTQEPTGSNWSEFLTAMAAPQTTADVSPAEPPALVVHELAITQAVVEWTDSRRFPKVVTQLDPLDLVLNDVTTQSGQQGTFSLTALTPLGARVAWAGSLGLNPIASRGTLSVSIDDVARLNPMLPSDLAAVPQSGTIQIDTGYQVSLAGKVPSIELAELKLKAAGLVLAPTAGKSAARLAIGEIGFDTGQFTWPQQRVGIPNLTIRNVTLGTEMPPALDSLAVQTLQIDGLDINLATRSAQLGGFSANDSRLNLARDAHGQIDLVELLTQFSPPAAANPTPSWRYAIDRLAVADAAISLSQPAAFGPKLLQLNNITLELLNLSEKLERPLPLKAEVHVASGGNLRLTGKVAPSGNSAEMDVQVNDLSLKPAQTWLTAAAALIIKDGRIQAKGRLTHDRQSTGFTGSARIDGLDLVQEALDETFLGWKSLTAASIDVNDRSLEVPELRLDGLKGKFIIYTDKSINLKRIQRSPAASAPESALTPSADTAGLPPSRFQTRIGRIRLREGQVDFGDYALVLPFEAKVHALDGVIAGLATTPGVVGQIQLEGEVDDYGLARAEGDIDLLNPTANTKVAVSFRNVEMTRLTPYLATFAGRSIQSGKMSLDLNYSVQQRAIQGQNTLVIQSLQLGDRVESSAARELPLDMAIALLEDTDGRINLEIPVSGSLDEPGFSYGHLLWQAIGNVLGKLATAPFRALGKLFGGGGESEPIIAFEPGMAHLAPPEREKIVNLANGMKQRSKLKLVIQGLWTKADAATLRERQLRRTVRALSGDVTSAEDDRIPLQLQSAEVRKGLEDLAAQRLGSKALATLREAHRQANPEIAGQAFMQRLAGQVTQLLDAPPPPTAKQIAAAKGRDFHADLYALLLASETVESQTLAALATARGDHVAGLLSIQQLPTSRWRTEAGAEEGIESKVPANESGRGLHLGLEVLR